MRIFTKKIMNQHNPQLWKFPPLLGILFVPWFRTKIRLNLTIFYTLRFKIRAIKVRSFVSPHWFHFSHPAKGQWPADGLERSTVTNSKTTSERIGEVPMAQGFITPCRGSFTQQRDEQGKFRWLHYGKSDILYIVYLLTLCRVSYQI